MTGLVRIFFVLVFCIFLTSKLLSQDNPPLGVQYLMEDRFLLSPAWAGYSDAFQLRISSMHQWVGIEDAPSTQVLSLNGMTWNNAGLGVIFYNDKSAFYSQIRMQFSFAYHMEFSTRELNMLSFGISGIYQENRVDQSQFTDIPDPSVDRYIVVTRSLNFNLGATYRRENFYSSINVDNIIPKTVKDNLNVIEPRIVRNYYLLSGYNYEYTESINLEPSFMVNYVEHEFNSYFDINFKASKEYKKGTSRIEFWTIFSFRSSFVVDDFQYAPNSLSIILGGRYDNYIFGTSFSQGLTSIAKQNAGTYLFSVGYDFLQWYRRKLCNCNTDKYK